MQMLAGNALVQPKAQVHGQSPCPANRNIEYRHKVVDHAYGFRQVGQFLKRITQQDER